MVNEQHVKANARIVYIFILLGNIGYSVFHFMDSSLNGLSYIELIEQGFLRLSITTVVAIIAGLIFVSAFRQYQKSKN